MSSKHQLAAIGIDVGGTKIAGGVVLWPSGEVLFPSAVPTLPGRGGEAVLASTMEIVGLLLATARANAITIRGVGVGVAELVDAEGNVTSAQTIHWQHLPILKRLSEFCPAQVESDVRASALAEATFGAGRGFSSFVYVTVGTGISCCLVQEGQPLTGARGNALVMASSPLSTVCTACGTELHPILEEFASGPAIAARYREVLSASTSDGVCPPAVRAEEIFNAADSGDLAATEILRSAGAALGVSVAFIANVLDPCAVVVGGGLGLAGGIYWESFIESTRKHIWSQATRELPIMRAALGVNSGVIGAAAKVFATQSICKEESQST